MGYCNGKRPSEPKAAMQDIASDFHGLEGAIVVSDSKDVNYLLKRVQFLHTSVKGLYRMLAAPPRAPKAPTKRKPLTAAAHKKLPKYKHQTRRMTRDDLTLFIQSVLDGVAPTPRGYHYCGYEPLGEQDELRRVAILWEKDKPR